MQSQKKIIISRLLDSNPRLLAFLFESPLSTDIRERTEVLLNDSWELNSEQQILIRVALDIWSGGGHAFLWDLLSGLSDQNFSRLMRALIAYRALINEMSELASRRTQK